MTWAAPPPPYFLTAFATANGNAPGVCRLTLPEPV